MERKLREISCHNSGGEEVARTDNNQNNNNDDDDDHDNDDDDDDDDHDNDDDDDDDDDDVLSIAGGEEVANRCWSSSQQLKRQLGPDGSNGRTIGMVPQYLTTLAEERQCVTTLADDDDAQTGGRQGCGANHR